jgi:hypothetical protein
MALYHAEDHRGLSVGWILRAASPRNFQFVDDTGREVSELK